jgi:uncharacterized protein (DUF1501 family)
MYGQFPSMDMNGPDNVVAGNWLPTTAIDQYFATLASWFGIGTSNLGLVFPNLGRFALPNLGFV